MTAYETYAPILEALEGRHARLIYGPHNAIGASGIVTVKDYGHCRDISIGHASGFNWSQVIGVEVKGENGRYSAV